ncbi:asparagine synthase (glutamine-hydrolyzing) [Butyrivibrio sp. NC3005]|uniref:asparagine synthase (glutamine-hydrolyzing) n=1 Tax=Butyrivibrio sp. NC3005 TaxID=1280685 RepID=UPI000410A2E7|nr:asparagine synthase (glutamine-hydrolyzing) [Butyrivibrio sp. NC3005]
MCGIAGFFSKNNVNKPDKDKLKIMTDLLAHRGPDAEGQWCDGLVGLGHRRLSIIDLNEQSNQPMLSHDGRFVITYNGEVYNYKELRVELEEHGAVFNTESDTEVIIESYRYWGRNAFNKLNGMWAFCLYDVEKKELVLCRDRFGIKPLFYIDREDVFAFSSEAKAILGLLPDEKIPNETCIYRYLAGTLNEDVDEKSFYKNIKIFPAAHYMTIDAQNGESSIKPYWEVDEKKFRHKWIKGKNPIKTFKKLFENSVELRLRADVEVGACLSGGIDSSAIVGCASKKYGRKMHTFSSIYEDPDCNEERYITDVNKKWNTKAHFIKPDEYENDFVEYVKKITYHHDQPFTGASLFSQYMVMNSISGNVKVVLDGQGADELFAGYIPYYSHYIYDLLDKGTLCARLKAIRLLTVVNKYWHDIIGAISTDSIVRLVGIKNSFRFQNNQRIAELRIKRTSKMFTDSFMGRVHEDYSRKDIKLSSKLNTRLCNDVINKSIPALLHNEDGNSMAFSIESRVPFLDYRIVEFAMALDGKYKIRDSWTKWIVRKACREYLPNSVYKRKNKMGFPAPFSRWLRQGKSKEEIKKIIYEFSERGIVPKDTVLSIYNSHMKGEGDYSTILFRMFNLQLWLVMNDMKENYSNA